MHARSVALVATLLLAPASLQAQMRLGEGAAISFASVAEGRRVLTNRDDFVERMSPFDRAARLKTDKDVSERQYLEFVGQNVLEWNDAETQKVNSALHGIREALQAMALPFPESVLIIKTTGKEEGEAVYTRANAIVFPQAELERPAARVQKKILHELFHIMSRANPDLRDRLYAAIGFTKCHEVPLPAELKSRKITNPDAPRNDHCIRVRVGDEEQWAVPILLSAAERYDMARGGEFFDYLQLRLLLVEWSSDEPVLRPLLDGQKPRLVDVKQVTGFFERVGKNTDYIYHPDEILADNFTLLVLGQRDLPSPEVIERIQEILRVGKTAESAIAAAAN